jgi:transcriptional antiterminator NusG
MDMTDQAYHLVTSTPKVTGFLGSGKKPIPVSENEVKRILGQMEEDAERPRPTVSYEIGETVNVIDGHFQSFNGVVEEVDDENGRLKVAINIFGRATPVELEYAQVEKSA